MIQEDHVGALSTMNNQAICIQGNCIDRSDTAGCNGKGWTKDVSFTLNTLDRHAVLDSVPQDETELYQASSFGSYEASEGAGSLRASGGDLGGGSENIVVGAKCADDYKGANRQYVDDKKLQVTDQYVRRLTPLECERLQGFPDGWTDIPGATDSKRYRALGNSIALPFGLSLPSGLSALVR